VPLERGEIPSYDSLRRILSELGKHVHFRRALPVKPEVFPMKVENVSPFDIYHNVMASPITLRDLDYRNDRGQTLPPRLLLYQSIDRYIYNRLGILTVRINTYNIAYDITIYKGRKLSTRYCKCIQPEPSNHSGKLIIIRVTEDK
jgi:hypothetical protein